MVHRRVEHAGDAVGLEHLDGGTLEVGRAGRVDREEDVAALPCLLLGAENHGAGEGGGGDLVADQADHLGPALAENLRVHIGAVTEAHRRSPDAFGSLIGDPARARVVEHHGDGGLGDVRLPGHVVHRGALRH